MLYFNLPSLFDDKDVRPPMTQKLYGNEEKSKMLLALRNDEAYAFG